MNRLNAKFEAGQWLLGLAVLALAICGPAQAQSRVAGLDRCPVEGANSFYFDITPLQADFKVMVSEYEVEPDITIRLVSRPELADLVLADAMREGEVTVCKSTTRHRSTTLFVAKFVTQPDVVIMLNPRAWHADYTLYVDSEIYTADQAAALFATLWELRRENR